MFRKALTNFIILGLIILPVQVLSAGIEDSNMQIKMQLKMSQMKEKAESKCMHQMSEKSKQSTSKKSCCNEHSNQCKSCNNCPPVVSALILTAPYQAIHPSFKKQALFISHLLLNGTHPKNLLKPPRYVL